MVASYYMRQNSRLFTLIFSRFFKYAEGQRKGYKCIGECVQCAHTAQDQEVNCELDARSGNSNSETERIGSLKLGNVRVFL